MVFPLGDAEQTRIVPVATFALIALNVVAYAYQLERGNTFTDSLAMTPYEVSHNYDLELPRDERLLRLPGLDGPIEQARVPFPVRLTLLTAMFLHSDPLHLAMNMLFLWIFGDNVEEVLGSVRFVAFYLACGLAGSLALVAAGPNSVIPSLGASAAIAGVMGAYVVWFPRNRVRVLVVRFVVEVPAIVVVGAWFGFQVWRGVGSFRDVRNGVGGVAYLAHVGGAVLGVVVAILLRPRARALSVEKARADRHAPEPAPELPAGD